MTVRRIDMHRIQKLIRLHRMDQSVRSIARQLRMGRDTVRSEEAALRADHQLDEVSAALFSRGIISRRSRRPRAPCFATSNGTAHPTVFEGGALRASSGTVKGSELDGRVRIPPLGLSKALQAPLTSSS